MKHDNPVELMCVHKESYPADHPCKSRKLKRNKFGFVRCFGGEKHQHKVDCSYVDLLNNTNSMWAIMSNCKNRLDEISSLLSDLEIPDPETNQEVVETIREFQDTFIVFNRDE